MPRASAVAHKALSWRSSSAGSWASRARAACTSGRCSDSSSSAARSRACDSLPDGSGACSQKARRSCKAAGTVSSSLSPSSSATTPSCTLWLCAKASRWTCNWRVSSTDASLAAVSALARSAMASSSRPPSAWLSRPGCSTGCPRLSVAARSSPPSRALSLAPCGIRRSGVPDGSSACRRSSQAWRQGPGAARRQAPPRPTGSMASKTAASASS